MLVRTLPLVVAALLTVSPLSAEAQLRATLLATGFNRPNGVVIDPVVPGAVYVVDQSGLVRAFLNGAERPTPLLDLRGLVSNGGEQGLLGLAFPPDAAASGRVFVNFTNSSGHTVVARFVRSAADPMVIDAASRFDLMWPNGSGGRQGFISQPQSNHNGGHLAFGPDGYLYIGLGDGGGGDDPGNNAQNPAKLLGKMLRIDVSGSPTNGYTIPASNPVPAGDMNLTGINALPEIWAFGLRNPWRYTFDDLGPGATGALIIGDVGQNSREEIDYEPANQSGRNYGWRVREGTRENIQEAPAYFPLTSPIFEYPHVSQNGEAVTGGYVYRGAALGVAYQGRYIYADCVTGRIFSMGLSISPLGEATTTNNVEHTGEMGGPFQCISSFARDTAGELYFMDFGYSAGNTGRIFRIDLATPAAPGAPQNLAASVQGNAVTFTWSAPASGSAPTSYVVEAGTAQGLANLGSATTTATMLAVGGVPTGQYFVRVRARNAVGTSVPSADVIATVGCTAPAPPSTFTTSVAGNVVTVAWNVAPGTTTTVIDAGTAPGATSLSTPFAAPSASIAVPGVPPGTYYLRARALNTCGTSTASVERTVVVP
jgi:glucose/arabinose dehydrogenase